MSYNGGIQTRLDDAWGAEIFGPDGLPISQSETLERMRNRSRHLERNNALASSVLDRYDENVIGTGIRTRSTSTSTVFRDKVNDLWRKKTEGKLFDVRRMYSWDMMQSLMNRSTERDGDVALVLIDRGAGPEVQLVEGHLIDTPRTGYNVRIVDGVEFSSIGAPVAYWIDEIDSYGIRKPRRLLARDVIFIHRTDRYNCARGTPAFHGTYSLFEQIVAVMDALVVKLRVEASQALIVRKKRAAPTGYRTTTPDSQGRVVPSKIIEPGMVNTIEADDEIFSFNPSSGNQSVADVLRVFARFVGLKFGLTIERVLLDFSGANYSVSRSTALQERRTAEVRQWRFDHNVFTRLWPWFVAKSIKNGDLVGPVPDDAWRYDWTPNGRPLVEPSKDAPGLKVLTDMGLPPQVIFDEMGYESEQLCKDSAQWVEMRKQNGGLPPFGFSANAGTAPVNPAEPKDDEEEE